MKKYVFVFMSGVCGLLVSGATQAVELERILNLRGSWKFSIGDDKNWAKPGYNDSDWDNIYAPGSWENEGYYGYDGYAWYRKSFDGEVAKDLNSLYIMAGYIDDVDEVYINGKLVGFSGGMPPKYSTAYKAKRVYYIPKEIINIEGKNIIAIRIYDEGGEGGIVHGRIGLYKSENDYKPVVDLQGLWKFKTGNNPDWKQKYWNDEKWESILTPSLWRNVGYWKLDGYAWYRKTFYLDDKYKDKDLFIVLGKIDDFDETYLNGKFVGRTKDDGKYGQSWSWQKYRAYKLPESIITFNGYNTIAVEVYDMGNHGGIYEGPVGIFTRSQLQDLNLFKQY